MLRRLGLTSLATVITLMFAAPAVRGAVWNEVAVRAGRCAFGTPYAFWVHRGDPRRVVIYFQRGGGCYSYDTCIPSAHMFSAYLLPGPHRRGIFDLARKDNPFRAWSFVLVPYCTGDVHWGSHVQTYTSQRRHLVVRHVGFRNGQLVLRWVYRHYRRPQTIFVTGSSAGSVGSAVFAPYVMHHYTHATVNQLGDSLAFVFPRAIDLHDSYRVEKAFPPFIHAFRTVDSHRMTMAQYYTTMARAFPHHTFAQFNNASDEAQIFYFKAFGGRGRHFPRALTRSLHDISRAAPNFRSYTALRRFHTVLAGDVFYSIRVSGTSLRGWVAALANGRPVRTVLQHKRKPRAVTDRASAPRALRHAPGGRQSRRDG